MPKFEDIKRSKGDVKPDYQQGNVTRDQQEAAEGLNMVEKPAPKTRYATKQQVSEVKEGESITTPKTGFTKKTTSAGGSSVKQEVASKVLLSDADYAGSGVTVTASASRSGLKSMSYSGDAGSILGSAANTPVVGKPSRSEGRFEKKLDAPLKQINFLASEQVVTEYQNPKPLGESGAEKQGYFGTPKNTSVRSQKSAGGTPASLLVERSADEITKDMVLFVNGQYVKSPELAAVMGYETEPTKISTFNGGVREDVDLNGAVVEDTTTVRAPITYGNWLNRKMTVIFAKDENNGPAYVSSVTFDSEDMSTDEEANVVNSASTNYIIDMNRAEVARQTIDSKAGRETELTWSPLGRAVPQPTATVGLLSALESDLGANVFTSYKFAKKAHSYQFNKAAKDGQRETTPGREMIIGDIAGYMSSQDFSDGSYFNGHTQLFGDRAEKAALYSAGAASMFIELFDSVSKYKSKGDILLQPRSLRRAFQVADNSMDVFRLKDEFAAALNNVDVFSTIDRDYDPLLPVCITDRVGLISPISYARFGNFTRANAQASRTYAFSPFTYAYANRSSNYTVTVLHPLLDGVSTFFEQYAGKFYDMLTPASSDVSKSGTRTLTINIHSSTKTFSTWDFLLLYAVPYMVKSRINSMRDVLDFEVNFEYPFALSTIRECNPNNAVNYNFVDIDHPLESRRMIPSAAISWTMPEFHWGVGDSDAFVLPWYFNEMQFTVPDANAAGGTSYSMEFMNGIMSFPVIRNGVRLGYLDDIYSMEERDVRLCLDRMVRPCIGASGDTQFNVYKYGQANEGIPCIQGSFTIRDYLSTPRELGWFANAPHGLLRVKDNFFDSKDRLGAFADLEDVMNGDTSFRLYCWKGVSNVPSAILDNSEVNISRAQAFRQYWDCSPACLMSPTNTDEALVNGTRRRLNVGFLPSLKQCFNRNAITALRLVENEGYFTPFTVGYAENANSKQEQSTDDELRVVALHKGLWGRIQRLPMAISPWDTCDFYGGTGANYDPYDLCYMFGMAGTMASDYNQDLYDRTNQVQDQGWLYTSDPFVSASPVFKDSVKYKTIQATEI